MNAIQAHPWPGPCPALAQGAASVFAIPGGGEALPPAQRREQQRRTLRHAARQILAEYLQCPPEAVPLSFPANAPPRLDGTWRGHPLGLSISHAEGLSLLAICPDGPVGVDIVKVENLPDWENIAQHYLGPTTTRELRQTPPEHRPHAFARAWAALEACCKRHGQGVREWGREMETRLHACETAAVEGLPPGYAGVVAVCRSFAPMLAESSRVA